MGRVKPYTLTQAQQELSTRKGFYSKLNERRSLERALIATGTVDGFANEVGMHPDGASAVLKETLRVEPEAVNRILPALTLQHASIVPPLLDLDVRPTMGGPEADDRALIATQQLDYIWHKDKGLETIERCAWDYLGIGEMVSKVVWEEVYEDRETSEEEREDAYQEALAAALDIATIRGSSISDFADEQALRDSVPQSTTMLRHSGIVHAYVDPCDFMVDANATSLDDARWVVQRLVLPMDELKAREDLKNTDDLMPDGPLGGDLFPKAKRSVGAGTTDNDPTLTCVIFEFYDCRTRTLLIFQESSAAPLYEGPWPYDYAGLPFEHEVLYREKPSDFHGFGEVRNVAPLQLARNESQSKQLENARQAASHKYLYDADNIELTEDNKDALVSDVPGEAVGLHGIPEGMPLQNVFVGWQPNALSSDVYQAIGTMDDAISTTLGQNDFEQGGTGVSHQSGTAASYIAGIASDRKARKVAGIERHMGKTSQIKLALFRENMGDQQLLRISGPKGSVEIVVTPDMLMGEFGVTVRGASDAKNSATRKQDALDLINVLAPALAANGYETEPVLRKALSLGWNLDPDVYLKKAAPAPAPEAPPAPAPAGDPMADPMAAGMDPMAGMPPAMDPYLGPQNDLGGDVVANQLDGGIAL